MSHGVQSTEAEVYLTINLRVFVCFVFFSLVSSFVSRFQFLTNKKTVQQRNVSKLCCGRLWFSQIFALRSETAICPKSTCSRHAHLARSKHAVHSLLCRDLRRQSRTDVRCAVNE